MNDHCGHCSHHRDAHYKGRWCGYILSSAGTKHECLCGRFVSIRTLIALRVGVIFACVAVLGTFEGLLGSAPR